MGRKGEGKVRGSGRTKEMCGGAGKKEGKGRRSIMAIKEASQG